MKHTKKLIPAIGMLLLSACMLVTSTFAWFSMNENVAAKNMTIVAKGDQVYLQIINEKNTPTTEIGYDNAFINGKAQTWASANATTAELLPANVKAADGTSAYAGGINYKWVTATGTAPSNGRPVGAYTPITLDGDGNAKNYFLRNTFKIRLDPTAGAANASAPLTVDSVVFADTYVSNDLGASVCVLVVCGNNSQLWTQDAAAGTFAPAANSSDYLDAVDVDPAEDKTVMAFNNTTGVTVEIYVFFNGDHANCTLEKLAAAKNATNSYPIEVNFTVAKQNQSQGS